MLTRISEGIEVGIFATVFYTLEVQCSVDANTDPAGYHLTTLLPHQRAEFPSMETGGHQFDEQDHNEEALSVYAACISSRDHVLRMCVCHSRLYARRDWMLLRNEESSIKK